MEGQSFLEKVHSLSDLELAALLCLVENQHCIIKTEEDCLELLVQELQLGYDSYFSSRPPGPQLHTTPHPLSEGLTDNRKISNIIIAKNLNLACAQVQIQALEANMPPLSVICSALTVVMIAREEKTVFHPDSDGFPNIGEASGIAGSDDDSMSSVVRRTPVEDLKGQLSEPLISMQDIDHIASLSQSVAYSTEVKSYVQHIVTFLRLHRAVAGGVSARATQHFDALVRFV
ncbi:hypothetical protein FGG08_000278 [Glutinoglossum americanum]|uniref:Uncharacterized protein n=1 Tax=Glutinoglossum americanum TaxID=1670608 RepID=A0A9P8I9D3_9PEZI|nr:hypothetical protein FGG08_000278 [Glutinoglossum americanum]